MKLKWGSTGNAVKEVQTMLINLGYSCGPPGVDGILKNYTDAAIRKFQTNNGLVVDGIVGPITYSKLKEKYDAKNKPTEPPKPPQPVIPKVPAPPSKNLDTFMASINANSNNLVTIVNTSFNPPRAINFYHMSPDDITESHTAEFEPVVIKSRSNPLAAYSGSGARTTDLSFDIHEDDLRVVMGPSADIIQFVGQVKALTYPRYQGGVVIPPRVFIKIGDFFRMKAYCSSVNVTWKKPIRNNRYICATLAMSFSEILSMSFTADEISTGGDLGRYYKFPG
jgi:hypothetical protein